MSLSWALSLTQSLGISRTSATTTSVFWSPGIRRRSSPVEPTRSAPCAATMGYKGEGRGSGREWEEHLSGQSVWWGQTVGVGGGGALTTGV